MIEIMAIIKFELIPVSPTFAIMAVSDVNKAGSNNKVFCFVINLTKSVKVKRAYILTNKN